MNDSLANLQRTGLLKDRSFIDGVWVASSTNDTFAVTNPFDNQLIGAVPNMTSTDLEGAIQAADCAFKKWSSHTGKYRGELLSKWFSLINENAESLAVLLTLEQGKPLSESRNEIIYGASFVQWFSEEAKRVSGAIPSSTWSDRRMLVLKQPIGVCAAITPWNFPMAMVTRKVAPALAAGCTILLKPAEQTPLLALALAELASRAGIPNGVFNVITSDSERSIEIGKKICASPIVRHLSFTGSNEVGRILMAQCAPTVKKMSLELGGHAPFIVFEDADIDAAVQGAINSKYRNAGQTCVCANLFYVHSKVYKEFVTKFSQEISKIALGNGMSDNVSQGPLIDDQAVLKVERHIADAKALGAEVVVGGARQSAGSKLFKPTVLGNVTSEMLVTKEETFGPVAPIVEFESEEDVIKQANNTDFGLAGYFYTKDNSRIWRVSEQLEFGMLGINTGLFSNEVAPFGGVKQSGIGREGGVWGIEEYLEMKYLCVGIENNA